MPTTPLSSMPKGSSGIIHAIIPIHDNDLITQRLCDVGFTPGAVVQVIAKTFFTQGPIAVKIGFTRFALRYTEAARILVKRCS